MFKFEVIKNSKKNRARCGQITTNHGIIETPAFVAVGTAATIKSLSPEEIKNTNTQIIFVNTYHLFLQPGEKTIAKLGGVNKFMNWDEPTISDSGGFQVFSLAQEKDNPLVKITNDGVHFKSHLNGAHHFFTPQKSIEIQHRLGADIILCFDDCTPYPVTEKQARLSLWRTHRWALQSLEAHQKKKTDQALYGIVQGSVFERLRKESAKFIGRLPFDGFAIGGVSVGESKKEMVITCEWVIPFLPPEKPRHLLGVGEIDDIFAAVKRGVDTFDCVMPTRLGRMGHILSRKFSNARFVFDIAKEIYHEDKKPLEKGCKCETCQDYSRAYIHHLFKSKELLGYRLATIHNLHFINELTKQIRQSIENRERKFSSVGKVLVGKKSLKYFAPIFCKLHQCFWPTKWRRDCLH